MKKIIYTLIIILINLTVVHADYSVSKYKIDLNILENGNVEVIEVFKLNGEYNGYERIINYKNNYNNYYGEKITSKDKNIYDGTNLKIEEIRAVNYEEKDYVKHGDLFTHKDDAEKGQHGYYKIIDTENGKKIRIYNPSKMNKDFYIKYTLKNMVVTHDDISELAMFIFNELNEDINNLEINIKIKNTKKLEVWTHKKSNIKIEKNKIKVKINQIKKNEKFDIRIIFDKLDTNKKSNILAYDKIKEIEKNIDNITLDNSSNEYNQKRNEAYNLVNNLNNHNRTDYNKAYFKVLELDKNDKLKTELLIKLLNIEPKIERNEELTKIFYTSIMIFWIIGIILFLYYFYKKYCFRIKETNDKIKKINPAIIGYLKNRKVSINDLVASFIYLIEKNKIEYEKKSDYYKFKIIDTKKLSNSEHKLIHFLFNDKETINTNQLSKKSKKDFDSYLKLYSNWIDAVSCEGNKYFYNLFTYKLIGITYSILGLISGVLLLNKTVYFSPILLIILSILSFIIFILIFKRNELGVIEYKKWKKYMNINEDIIYELVFNKKITDKFTLEIKKIMHNNLKNALDIKKSIYN